MSKKWFEKGGRGSQLLIVALGRYRYRGELLGTSWALLGVSWLVWAAFWMRFGSQNRLGLRFHEVLGRAGLVLEHFRGMF